MDKDDKPKEEIGEIPPPSLTPPTPPPPLKDFSKKDEDGERAKVADESSLNTASNGEESPAEIDDMASLGTRIIAVIIDSFIAIGIYGFLLWILPNVWVFSRMSWLVAAGYLIGRDSLPFLADGSLGKMVMKLRVVTDDGDSIIGNWRAALFRNLPISIPPFALIEIIVLIVREDGAEKGKRLGDDWAGTKVIRTE